MKVYVDKKPENCGLCKIVDVKVLDVMENREMLLQHICPLLDLSVNPDKLDVGCPLIELKPKDLEWNYDGEEWYAFVFDFFKISFTQMSSGISIIYTSGKFFQKHNDKSNKELKELCQEIYNDLFYEIVGGKNV